MDKETRKVFAQIKSQAKTKDQRKAFNRLIDAFSDKNDLKNAIIDAAKSGIGQIDIDGVVISFKGEKVPKNEYKKRGIDKDTKGDLYDVEYFFDGILMGAYYNHSLNLDFDKEYNMLKRRIEINKEFEK